MGRPPLARQSMYRLVSFAAQGVIFLALTPYLITELGVEQFGLWSFALAVGNAAGLLEWGIGTSTVYYVAKYLGQDRSDRAFNYAALALVINAGTGVVAAALIVVFSSRLLGMLGLPLTLDEVGHTVLLLFAARSVPFLAFRALIAVPMGFQRYGIASILLFFKEGGSLLAMAAVLWFTQGDLVAGVTAQLAVTVLAAAAAFACAYHPFRGYGHFLAIRLDGALLRNLVAYSLPVGLAGLSKKAFESLDRILVGAILGPAVLAYYAVAVALAGRVLTLAVNAYQVIVSRVSNQWAEGSRAGVWELFGRIYRLSPYIHFGIMMVLVVLSEHLLVIWLGADAAEQVHGPLLVLLIIYSLAALGQPAIYFLNAVGHPGIAAIIISIGSFGALLLIAIYGSHGLMVVAYANGAYLITLLSVPIAIRHLRASVGPDDRARRARGGGKIARHSAVPFVLTVILAVTYYAYGTVLGEVEWVLICLMAYASALALFERPVLLSYIRGVTNRPRR